MINIRSKRYAETLKGNLVMILNEYSGAELVDALTNFVIGRVGAAESRIKRNYELQLKAQDD